MVPLRKHILSVIISLALIGTVGYYMFNYIYYSHSHITKEGTIITHSHPYNKDDSAPFKNHTHSQSDLVLAGALKDLLIVFGFTFLFFNQKIIKKVFPTALYQNKQFFYSGRTVRGPPVEFPA